MISIQPDTKAAYRLMHDGILTLAEIERTGMRIDVDYCKRQIDVLDRRIERLITVLHKTKDVLEWKQIYKQKFNLESPRQLADYLYRHKGLTPLKTTEKGNASVDDESLKSLKEPFVQDLLRIRRLKKTRDTYLKGILSEVSEDGLLHPFFNLHTVKTFRGCVAKGSKILVSRDFEHHSEGIPIEDIHVGDYVYCFDAQLNPAVRKVLWAGKTGHKKVIRLHWRGGKGRRGYVDVTSEHLIRLVSGEYVQARDLIGDLRTKSESKHCPKIRVLSCSRKTDMLRFTGHMKNGLGILEHRLIYEQRIGRLKDSDIIHHRNGYHLDHSTGNLEKTNLSDHSSLHIQKTLLSPSSRAKNIEIVKQMWKDGKFHPPKGEAHSHYLGLSKFYCLRRLARAGGKWSKIGETDFATFKKYLAIHCIIPAKVKLRYDKDGRFISKGRLKQLSTLGRKRVQNILGINFYKIKQLYSVYGVDDRRRWANQFGSFVPGNHTITHLEYLDNPVDVYDLEVEEHNNFFANEVCVHNSSNSPNFQNLPIRDKEMGKIIRQAFIPHLGHRFGGVDYAAIEVKIAACYHTDQTMLEYIRNPSSDMHRDMAMECYKLEQSQVTKQSRYCAKNKFVFPQFYGDWYKSCAASLWSAIDEMELQTSNGMPMREHLKFQGISNYNRFEDHIRKVEDRFWNDRFPVYAQWKRQWIKEYERKGYFHTLTGFTCSGVMGKNDVVNYPVQGSAFHCLLWSLIRLHDWLKREKMQSMIVGQIHDEITIDAESSELDMVLKRAREIMCEEIRQEWEWIVTPLEIEAEFAPVDRSWYEKEKV
jgi:hypothetical protein